MVVMDSGEAEACRKRSACRRSTNGITSKPWALARNPQLHYAPAPLNCRDSAGYPDQAAPRSSRTSTPVLRIHFPRGWLSLTEFFASRQATLSRAANCGVKTLFFLRGIHRIGVLRAGRANAD